jgi:hypothetical protein
MRGMRGNAGSRKSADAKRESGEYCVVCTVLHFVHGTVFYRVLCYPMTKKRGTAKATSALHERPTSRVTINHCPGRTSLHESKKVSWKSHPRAPFSCGAPAKTPTPCPAEIR